MISYVSDACDIFDTSCFLFVTLPNTPSLQRHSFVSRMSRLLEACPFECLQNVDLNEKRNKIASIASGFLFFSGWWFAIDASATYYEDTRDVFHLCGVFATISMFMVNAVSNSLLRGEGFTDGCLGPVGARIWFFFGFMMGFGSLLGSFASHTSICIFLLLLSRFRLHPLWRVCA